MLRVKHLCPVGVAILVGLLCVPASAQTFGHRLLPPKPVEPDVTRHRNVPRIIVPQTISAGVDGRIGDPTAVNPGDAASPVAPPPPRSDGQGHVPRSAPVLVGYDLRKVPYPWGYFGAQVNPNAYGHTDFNHTGWRWTLVPAHPPVDPSR